MRFIDIQKRQWDKDTKDKDNFVKLAYYCNTKSISYFGVEFQMVYSALNCRIKRLLKKMGMKKLDWSAYSYYKILNNNQDMFDNR